MLCRTCEREVPPSFIKERRVHCSRCRGLSAIRARYNNSAKGRACKRRYEDRRFQLNRQRSVVETAEKATAIRTLIKRLVRERREGQRGDAD